MSALHPLLERQLTRIGNVDASRPPATEAWAQLLHRVSQTYAQADQDRYLLERSLNISSQEMQTEIAQRKQAQEALQQARENLERQNQSLERVNELFRAITDQLAQAINRGATASELRNELTLLQQQFEHLEQQRMSAGGSGGNVQP